MTAICRSDSKKSNELVKELSMIRIKATLALGALALLMLGACSKSESYSEMLRDEEKAVNWYLAQHRVEVAPPADSVFQTGEKAPFYRMDEDGTIYMQVIRAVDRKERPAAGEKVYFRFSRCSIKTMYDGGNAFWAGNADDLGNDVGPTYFFFGNKTYPSTTQFGTGLQVPMEYMGIGSEVNLVLKSYAGFVQDQTQCQPYLMNVKYFKAEY